MKLNIQLFGGRGASSSSKINKTLKEVERSIEYNKAIGQSSIKDFYMEALYNYITKNEKSKVMNWNDILKNVKNSIDLNKRENTMSIKDKRIEKMYNFIKKK